MLAGRAPFQGQSAQAIAALRLSAPPPSVRVLREEVPRPVDEVIRRALARYPAGRHGGPAAFAAALAAAAGKATAGPPG